MKTTNPAASKIMVWLKKISFGDYLLQWAVYIILFLVMVVFVIDHSPELPQWRFYGTVLVLAIDLVLNILWAGKEQSCSDNLRRALNWSFLITSALLIAAAVWMGELFNAVYLFFMMCAQAAIVLGVWPAGLIFCYANMVVWLAVFRIMGASNSSMVSFGLSLGVGILFVLFLAILLDRSARQTMRAEGLLKELQAANADLDAARRKEKELAIADERMRLARDIHDGLGHHLTVLSIQLQAADKLVERNPHAAQEAIRQCRSEARAALEEVRRSVGMMRQSPLESRPLDDLLAELVRDFDEHTGLQASFEQSGTPLELSSFARQTLFRAAQEGLTNVQKHARGVQRIQVKLEYETEHIRLVIRDDGQAPAAPAGEAGFGLKGLQERVNQLGGELCCGPGKSGGFEVEVCIPLQEAVDDQSTAG